MVIIISTKLNSCNPQIGSHNQNVLGSQLRTMPQVLRALVDQASTKAYHNQRMVLISRIQLAQVHEFCENYDQALALYNSVLKETENTLNGIHGDLEKELIIKKELTNIQSLDIMIEQSIKQNHDRVGMLKVRLDFWLELKHRVFFFLGGCYHVMASYSENDYEPKYSEFAKLEEQYYSDAANIRRKILGCEESDIQNMNKTFLSNADSLADHVRGNRDELIIYLPSGKYYGGILSATLFEKASKISEKLNMQWDLLDEWRFLIIESLTKPLEDAKDPQGTSKAPAGDEYDLGLANQEKLTTQLYCYQRLIYDRTVLLTGDRTHRGELEKNDVAAARYANSNFKDDHYFEPLDSKRRTFTLHENEEGLRRLISQMISLSKRNNIPHIESQMCAAAHLEFSHVYDFQIKILHKLEIELKHISDLMDHRKDYYIRLQKLSDGVVPLDRPEDTNLLEHAIKEQLNKFQIESMNAFGRQRYLEHLLTEDKGPSTIIKDMECTICKNSIDRPSIFPCGHYFCHDCVVQWLNRHHKCPTCNQVRKIRINE